MASQESARDPRNQESARDPRNQESARDPRQLTKNHLEEALAEDASLEKNYHIRSALQMLGIEDNEMFQ